MDVRRVVTGDDAAGQAVFVSDDLVAPVVPKLLPRTLELDDGAQVELHPGDTVVQNGTRHRWSNSGAEPAVLAFFCCGAHHDGMS